MLFDYRTVSPESVARVADEAIAFGDQVVDGVVSVDASRTFANTLGPLEDLGRRGAIAYGESAFLGHVSTSETVRDAAREAEERMQKWMLDLVSRRDVYEAVRTYADTEEAAELTGERARILEHTLRDFRMAGHELSPEDLQKVQDLRARLVELEIAFATNIAEFDDGIEVSRADLEGLPDSYVERLAPGTDGGEYRISMAYPDVIPFFDNSPRRDLREALAFKFNNRARESNTAILSEALALRADIARLFRADSWAHYSMQVKMAQNPEAVTDLYDTLVEPLQQKAKSELTKIEELLSADGEPLPVQTWDRAFYHTQQMKSDYGVDPMEVAGYFPLDRVLDGLFEITQAVFGLTYHQLPDAHSWHPDVRTYRVEDAASGELIAHFSMDLFPREGKFSHAAAFPLVPSANGLRPVSAIVANFTKPTADQPSLLQHDEVVTLFHEFGHILHMSLAKTEFARFSGGGTEWDFVEAPSQIMENWCWVPSVLQEFARHHETDEPIPEALVDQLVAARYLNDGLFKLRQIFFGQVDMDLHSTLDPVDQLEVLERRAPVGLLPMHDGTNMLPSFGHLLGGYDAGYYGYIWAAVFGDDMFSRFEEEGVLSPKVGMDYRSQILEPNGTKDAYELLRAFLGREPNSDAFLRKLGID